MRGLPPQAVVPALQLGVPLGATIRAALHVLELLGMLKHMHAMSCVKILNRRIGSRSGCLLRFENPRDRLFTYLLILLTFASHFEQALLDFQSAPAPGVAV